ncbi:MAG: type I pullulanase [Bacilli bacterium]|nr:type I pullulanase [Bacilli bacterium]
MKNTYFNAKLTSLRRITIQLFTSLPKPSDIHFSLLIEDEKPITLKLIRQVASNNIYLLDMEIPFDYPFGRNCVISSSYLNKVVTIDLSNAISFPEFDTLFNYDKDDLGAIYTKKQTTFTLWAPLASSAFLMLEDKNGNFKYHLMSRKEKGTYKISVEGDLLNRKYHYVINNSGNIRESNDPWGKGVSFDSKYSAVVDVEAIKSKKRITPKRVIKSSLDAIIYELHVRDFTIHKSSDIENKGKYLGLTEANRKTLKGNPAGLDYLKMLGVSHVQLQPVLDYQGHDNPDIKKEYNWGYDPISFFALEGSYSVHPEIPQSRLEEFRYLVDTLHKNDLRVSIDVVYNHLYQEIFTSFEKCVPGYFYRHRPNGLLSQASGCGNDFASERHMGRKAILDSVRYLFEVFDIDALRFDLMGLIDITTMNKIVDIAKKNKKDALIYGEGWNMGNELPFDKRACSDNHERMPEIFFFNDSYRDIIKGSTFDLGIKGYASGDNSYSLGFEYAFMGSVVNHCFAPRFKETKQSLNFVECHDNHTIFDKYVVSNANEDKEDIYARIALTNALLVLSCGVPFIHNGQEIGKSKCGLGNTYNVPCVNDFDYREVDERIAMVKYLSELISLRNNELSFIKNLNTPEDVKKAFTFKKENELLWITLNEEYKTKYQNIIILVNITNEPINYELDDYYQALLIKGGLSKREDLNIKNGRIAPHSIDILVR